MGPKTFPHSWTNKLRRVSATEKYLRRCCFKFSVRNPHVPASCWFVVCIRRGEKVVFPKSATTYRGAQETVEVLCETDPRTKPKRSGKVFGFTFRVEVPSVFDLDLEVSRSRRKGALEETRNLTLHSSSSSVLHPFVVYISRGTGDRSSVCFSWNK